MSIIAGYLLPHAPVFIKEVGGGQTDQVKNTINTYRKIAMEIEQIAPDLIIIISPHGPIFSDAIAVYDLDNYTGNMRSFGEYTLEYSAYKDKQFILNLIDESNCQVGYFYALNSNEFLKFQQEPSLDHGITVPLHFIQERIKKINLLAMSYGSLSYMELLLNGEILKSTIEKSGKRVVVIASGDMSHALSSKGPYNFHPDGIWFDQKMKENIDEQKPYNIFTEDENRISNAAECGLRSYAILMGALNGLEIESNVYSYEGPFGVGYLIAKFIPIGISKNNQIEQLKSALNINLEKQRLNAHVFVQLARVMIEHYVHEHVAAKWQYSKGKVTINDMVYLVDGYDQLLSEAHGTFVSIKKNGILRGCIGTISPTEKSTLVEILKNAISACSKDYRFEPIAPGELAQLTISVDILSDLEEVLNIKDLNPAVFGIIVYSKGRKGVLLPNLEGVSTTEQQLQIASNKGGFTVDEIDHIDSFTVERFF